jgi:hypothetical protein
VRKVDRDVWCDFGFSSSYISYHTFSRGAQKVRAWAMAKLSSSYALSRAMKFMNISTPFSILIQPVARGLVPFTVHEYRGLHPHVQPSYAKVGAKFGTADRIAIYIL